MITIAIIGKLDTIPKLVTIVDSFHQYRFYIHLFTAVAAVTPCH